MKINEQMRRNIELGINNISKEIDKGIDKDVMDMTSESKKVHIVAVGSSYNAAQMALPFIKKTKQECVFLYYAEQFLRHETIYEDDLYILISQSGLSKTIIKAYEAIAKYNKNIILITESRESKLSKKVNNVIYIHDIKELVPFKTTGVINTFLKMLMLFKINLKQMENIVDINHNKRLDNKIYHTFSKKITRQSRIIILYDMFTRGIVEELMLKIIEASWIPAFAFEIEDFCHGKDSWVTTDDHFIIITSQKNDVLFHSIKSYSKLHGNGNVLNFADDIFTDGLSKQVQMMLMLYHAQYLAVSIKEKLNPEATTLRFKELVDETKDGKWDIV